MHHYQILFNLRIKIGEFGRCNFLDYSQRMNKYLFDTLLFVFLKDLTNINSNISLFISKSICVHSNFLKSSYFYQSIVHELFFLSRLPRLKSRYGKFPSTLSINWLYDYIFTLDLIKKCFFFFSFPYIDADAEMSPEQQKQLIEIRKKKQELLLEIQVSQLFTIPNTEYRINYLCLLSGYLPTKWFNNIVCYRQMQTISRLFS